MEIVYTCAANMIAPRHMGLLSICNVASKTEKLNF